MDFIPAGEIIGDKHLIREVTIVESVGLPDGDYSFIDYYCTDAKCDCRKTIIRIHLNGEHVSTVDYGWEKPSYYVKWGKFDDEMNREMSGLSIDFMSPDLLNPNRVIEMMEKLIDNQWIEIIKDTYREVRNTLREEARASNVTRLFPKISRNALCTCGSGLKFKRCCGK